MYVHSFTMIPLNLKHLCAHLHVVYVSVACLCLSVWFKMIELLYIIVIYVVLINEATEMEVRRAGSGLLTLYIL